MNRSKFDIAKAALDEFRKSYSDLLISAQRLEFALESLSAEVLELQPANLAVREILRTVATDYQLAVNMFLTPLKTKRLAEARHMAMLLCRERTTLSYTELGREFRRDHGAIMHGVKHAKNLIEVDLAFRNRYQRLMNAVRVAA